MVTACSGAVCTSGPQGAGSLWGGSDRAQAPGRGRQRKWALSRASQQRESWAGQREEWGGPGMDTWGGVKTGHRRPTTGPARQGPPSPPPRLGAITFSMFLDFLPQGLCPGHTLCPECPLPRKRHSSDDHVFPEAPSALRTQCPSLVQVTLTPASCTEALIIEKYLFRTLTPICDQPSFVCSSVERLSPR